MERNSLGRGRFNMHASRQLRLCLEGRFPREVERTWARRSPGQRVPVMAIAKPPTMGDEGLTWHCRVRLECTKAYWTVPTPTLSVLIRRRGAPVIHPCTRTGKESNGARRRHARHCNKVARRSPAVDAVGGCGTVRRVGAQFPSSSGRRPSAWPARDKCHVDEVADGDHYCWHPSLSL